MNKKAFTLVEMAIVLVIIGVLAAMVVSNIGGFGKKARDQKRATDLQKAYTILAGYFGNNGLLPSPGTNKKFSEVAELSQIKAPLSGEEYYYNTSSDVNKAYLGACFELGNSAGTPAYNLLQAFGVSNFASCTNIGSNLACPGGSSVSCYEVSF